MTFWLFTHSNGTWVKGEGTTDAEAIAQAFQAAAAPAAQSPREVRREEIAKAVLRYRPTGLGGEVEAYQIADAILALYAKPERRKGERRFITMEGHLAQRLVQERRKAAPSPIAILEADNKRLRDEVERLAKDLRHVEGVAERRDDGWEKANRLNAKLERELATLRASPLPVTAEELAGAMTACGAWIANPEEFAKDILRHLSVKAARLSPAPPADPNAEADRALGANLRKVLSKTDALNIWLSSTGWWKTCIKNRVVELGTLDATIATLASEDGK